MTTPLLVPLGGTCSVCTRPVTGMRVYRDHRELVHRLGGPDCRIDHDMLVGGAK